MNNFSTYVGIIATLMGIAGTVATLLEKGKIDKKKLTIILPVLGVVILSGVFFSTSTTITPHAPTNPFSGIGDPAATETPTAFPSPTATQSVPTPTPSPILSGPRTFYPNIRLQCNCSDRVVVTITQIVIQPSQNRMLWSLTYYNNSQGSVSSGFVFFTLQKGDQIKFPTTGEPSYYATGQGVDSGVDLQAGDTKQATLTFSFVPYKNFPYTIVSNLSVNFDYVTFDPEVIQF